tara:strand:- start:766 stop:942 length:177 start_codon:yes stop_codon:yes gene_type:complete
MRQLEFDFEMMSGNEEMSEWEQNGFKTKEEWMRACAFDREFKYLQKGGHHFDYLTKKS